MKNEIIMWRLTKYRIIINKIKNWTTSSLLLSQGCLRFARFFCPDFAFLLYVPPRSHLQQKSSHHSRA